MLPLKVTATHDGAVLMLQAWMQDARSSSAAKSTAPGWMSVSQRTRYSVPMGSVYIVPFPAGHCGPEGVVVDDGEEDVIVDCVDIAVLIDPAELDEDEPAVIPLDEDVAWDETEEVDCPDTRIPTTYPLVPAVGPCGRCLR